MQRGLVVVSRLFQKRWEIDECREQMQDYSVSFRSNLMCGTVVIIDGITAWKVYNVKFSKKERNCLKEIEKKGCRNLRIVVLYAKFDWFVYLVCFLSWRFFIKLYPLLSSAFSWSRKFVPCDFMPSFMFHWCWDITTYFDTSSLPHILTRLHNKMAEKYHKMAEN